MIFANYRLRKWKRRLAIVAAKVAEGEATAKRTGYLYPVISSSLAGKQAEAQFMVELIESLLNKESGYE